MKRIFQSIALLLLFTTTIEAQINQYGIPFITNYTIKDYKAGTQNWAITQDNRGVLYFGNKSGILEYDGLNWRLIEVGNKSTVRSLGVDKRGVVYVGALAEFGYLAPDSTGLLRYVSISQSLDSAIHKFSNVWEIGSIGSNVFFRTEEAMFRFNYEQGASSGKQIKIWKAGDDIFKKMVVVNDKLYIRQRNLGILELTGDSLRLIRGGQAVNDSIVANAIMPYSKSQLLVGTSEALYLYDTQKTSDVFSLLPLQSASLFESNRLYDGILIPGNSYALATKQGVVSIDQYGKLLNWVNKQTFLQDEAVKFVYCNWTNNQLAPLWLALNDGIAKVEINSPIRLWNEATGLKGTVYDVIRYNSILYSATNMGAFYLNTPSNLLPSFAQVAKLPTSVWCFAIADVPTNPTKKNKPTNASILLAGADDGIYRITDIDAEIIFPTRAVFKILPSKLQPAIIFIGMADGLAILSYLNAKPELVKIPSLIIMALLKLILKITI